MIFLLSGCWDFQRMRDRMFISGIAIDKEDDGYIVGLESLNLHSGSTSQSQGNSNEAKFTIEKVSYPSIEIPLHSVQTKVNGEPFYSNIQVLIIGKRQAEEGISGIISHFLRDPDMRRTTPVVFTENPIELIKVKQKDQRFVSEYIKELITLTEGTGRTITTDIGSVSKAIHENMIEFIPNIKINKNKNEEIEVNGTSILKEGKLVGHLSEQDTIIVSYLKENVESGSLHMNCPQTGKGSVSMDIIHIAPNLHPKVKNGVLIIGGRLKVKGYLAEYTCGDGRIQGQTTLNKLENEFTDILSKDVNEKVAAIYKRTGEDVLNLKSIFEKDHPKTWDKIKPTFPDMVKSPIIDIKVSVDLILKGTES